MDIDTLPFVGAVHRRPRSTVPNLIVLHDGETDEGDTAAEGMAAYFASGKTTGSAHICVDNNSAVRCALDSERTNGAGGVNDIGLHLEQAGRARQEANEWDDEYSRGVVENAAEVCRGWIAKFPHIRPVFLNAARLQAGERDGITVHAEVSKVFAGNDGHWDPGPNYPIDSLLALITGSSSLKKRKPDMYLAQIGSGPSARYFQIQANWPTEIPGGVAFELAVAGVPLTKAFTAEQIHAMAVRYEKAQK